jgi:hypothetical protein
MRCRYRRTSRKTFWKELEKSLPRASKRDSAGERFLLVARLYSPACNRSCLKAAQYDSCSLCPLGPKKRHPTDAKVPLLGPSFIPLARADAQGGIVNSSLMRLQFIKCLRLTRRASHSDERRRDAGHALRHAFLKPLRPSALLRINASGVKQLTNVGCRHWPTKQVALHFVDTVFRNK